MSARPVRWLLLAALVLGLVAACGIPPDSAPRPLAEPTTTSPPTSPPAGGTSRATIYLVQSNPTEQLVPVDRMIEVNPTPEEALDLLLAAPIEEDTARGLTSSILTGTTAVDVSVEGDLVAVEMSDEWDQLGGADATVAYAQVVFTLTELPGIGRVRFSVDGQVIEAPTVSEGPRTVVERDDYAALDPG